MLLQGEASNKTVEYVIEKLEALAGSLQIGIEKIFPYYAKLVVVEGIFWASFGVVIITGAIMILVKAVIPYEYKAEETKSWSYIGCFIFALVGLGFLASNIPQIFVPQPEAISRILEIIK